MEGDEPYEPGDGDDDDNTQSVERHSSGVATCTADRKVIAHSQQLLQQIMVLINCKLTFCNLLKSDLL